MKRFLLRILYKLTYIVPKKSNLHVYLISHEKRKFSGNVKPQIIYAHQNHPEIESVLLTKYRSVTKEAKKYGISSIRNRFLRYWYLFRAEVIFIDAFSELFRFGRFQFVQLWHGAGFKCVGALRSKKGETMEQRREKYKQVYKRCILVAATSESNVLIQNQSFMTDKAAITGYPRNDIFFEKENKAEQIKEKYYFSKFSNIITYAPTFRDQETSEPFSLNFWHELNDLMIERNECFLIKKHPSDRLLKIPNSFSNIQDVSFLFDDMQELLLITDMLITDYSSISTDFALTNRPIIIYVYDFEPYIATCRKMTCDLEKTLPKPFIKTQKELLQALQDRNWTELPEVKESYQNFKNLFHEYLEGNSSQRIMEKVLK